MIEGVRLTSLSIESALAAMITGKDAVEQTFLEQETSEFGKRDWATSACVFGPSSFGNLIWPTSLSFIGKRSVSSS